MNVQFLPLRAPHPAQLQHLAQPTQTPFKRAPSRSPPPPRNTPGWSCPGPSRRR
jgi:hypothetical protein